MGEPDSIWKGRKFSRGAKKKNRKKRAARVMGKAGQDQNRKGGSQSREGTPESRKKKDQPKFPGKGCQESQKGIKGDITTMGS